MRIVKFIELFRKIKIEKDIKIFFHLATIIKNMHYLYIYYTYIVDQKAWKIAVSFQQSKFYIFRNFSFLLSYTCIPSFQRNLDAKREDIVTIAFKTRFAYIRPTARFFFTGDTTFFFCYTWKYELWYSAAILSGIEAELTAKIVASWNEQPLSPVKTGNRNSWLQRQPNSLGYYVAKIPFERS